MHRRDFLRLGLLGAGGVALGPGFWRAAFSAPAQPGDGPYGPLLDPDANGLALPAGFESRIVARSGEPVAGSGYAWHANPDGGATFPTEDGGWIYVSNSETFSALGGGAGAVRFGPTGDLVDAYRILEGTDANCAGGPTPWGTWLSCEEHPTGQVWECDPFGRRPAEVRPAMGRCYHEAVAVDPVGGRLYLTEDQPDGRYYRFTPAAFPDLSNGVLEAAEVAGDGAVRWHPISDPDAVPIRSQAPASTPFRGGEGIWYDSRFVYFTTKGDGRVWSHDLAADRIDVLYDAREFPSPVLNGVDNITGSAFGDLYVAEDGGNMEIVMLAARDRTVSAFLRLHGHDGSELTGPAFDPSGTRLYFSSQRGTDGDGVTYEVSGPFRLPSPAPTTTAAAPAEAPSVPGTEPLSDEGDDSGGLGAPEYAAGGGLLAGAAALGAYAARRRREQSRGGEPPPA